MAQSRQPDFIITDIMMPVMDGMTMIRKIKACPDTCHIPIVVLSARTAINYRIEGLNEGIDDYITKPFSVSYLKSRVDNIIRQRRQLQQAYVSKLNAAGDGHLIYKPTHRALPMPTRSLRAGLSTISSRAYPTPNSR